MVKLGILGSGKGSNFAAILDRISRGELDAQVVSVMSDNPSAGIFRLAEEANLECQLIKEPKYRTRLSTEVESSVAANLKQAGVELLILAGFMRMVKEPLLTEFPNRIINIHPSLLPKYPGLESWRQALEAGEDEAGCTVHLVDAGMDTGPILAQRAVPIFPTDTAESLHARIQEAEHDLLPTAIQEYLQGLRAE